MEDVFQAALRDAAILAEESFDGILVENFGDAPFYPAQAPAATVAAMSTVLFRLRQAISRDLLWGVNVLRNDARAALALAAVAQADFIRVNVHCGVVATDQGLLEGQAHQTLRERARLAPAVAILADARVKHGRALGPPSGLAAEVADLCERGLADAVLVTGARTGAAPSREEVEEAVRAAGSVPLLVASGVTADNVGSFLEAAGGIIVGTSLKCGGLVDAPVDRARARALIANVRGRT